MVSLNLHHWFCFQQAPKKCNGLRKLFDSPLLALRWNKSNLIPSQIYCLSRLGMRFLELWLLEHRKHFPILLKLMSSMLPKYVMRIKSMTIKKYSRKILIASSSSLILFVLIYKITTQCLRTAIRMYHDYY